LGFEVRGQTHKVTYVSERLRANPAAMISDGPRAEAHVMEILTTKFEHWRYEDEYRVFPELRDRDPTGLYFLEFGDQVALREVIVGHRAAVSRDGSFVASRSSVKRTMGCGTNADELVCVASVGASSVGYLTASYLASKVLVMGRWRGAL
jgi:hypothetical protein